MLEIFRHHGPEGDGCALTVEARPPKTLMVFWTADRALRVDPLRPSQAALLAAAERGESLLAWLETRIEAGDDPDLLGATVTEELRAGRLVAATPPQATSAVDQSSSR